MYIFDPGGDSHLVTNDHEYADLESSLSLPNGMYSDNYEMSWEKTMDCYSPGQGLMPASFKVRTIPAATPEDVNIIVEATRRAIARNRGSWATSSGALHAKYLCSIAANGTKRKSELARLEALDCGKPLEEAAVDIDDVTGCIECNAQLAEVLGRNQKTPISIPMNTMKCHVLREPISGVGLITPWNYPLLMATWKVSSALATGCAVILKPLELASITCLELADICIEVGLPPGVLNIYQYCSFQWFKRSNTCQNELIFVARIGEAQRLFSSYCLSHSFHHGFLLHANQVFIFLGVTSLRNHIRHLRGEMAEIAKRNYALVYATTSLVILGYEGRKCGPIETSAIICAIEIDSLRLNIPQKDAIKLRFGMSTYKNLDEMKCYYAQENNLCYWITCLYFWTSEDDCTSLKIHNFFFCANMVTQMLNNLVVILKSKADLLVLQFLSHKHSPIKSLSSLLVLQFLSHKHSPIKSLSSGDQLVKDLDTMVISCVLSFGGIQQLFTKHEDMIIYVNQQTYGIELREHSIHLYGPRRLFRAKINICN